MIDVLLLNLPIQTMISKKMVSTFEYNPSIGLMSLYSILDFNGYITEILDLVYDNYNKSQLIDKIKELEPILIGISAYTENISLAVRFARIIKQAFPNIYVVIGGAHVSLSQQEFYDNDEIDFIILNEGEATIVELITALKTKQQLIRYSDIDGLMYRENGVIYKNKKRGFIKALDIMPLPKREYFGLDRYKNNYCIVVSTSRGCPNKCIYCSANAMSGKIYRVRDIENVYLEMVMLHKLTNVKQITIADDSFTVIKKRVYKFLDLLDTYKPTFKWDCESIIMHMDEELLDRMAKTNIASIQYGMESGNQEVLNKIQKGTNLEYAERIIIATQKRGIIPALSFIFGHFCETKETANDTINFIKKAATQYDATIAASYNTPFPGTYQYDHADELKIKFLTRDYRMFTLLNPVMYTDNFSEDDQYNWVHEVKQYCGRKMFLEE